MNNLLSKLDFSYIYTFLSQATLGINFLFYILIARVVGPEQYGVFSSAVSLGGILAFFTQFGLSSLITREVANDPINGPKQTYIYLIIEGINTLFVLVILIPLAKSLGFEGNSIVICYLLVLSEVCRGAKQTIRGVFRGLSKFRTETITLALERVLVVVLSSIILFSFRELIWVVWALAIVRLLDLIGVVIYLNQQIYISTKISFQKLLNSLKRAYPFALSGFLWILYYQIDILMLKGLTVPEQAGYYSAAYRIIEIFIALPQVIFLVSFTKFAQCENQASQQLSNELFKSGSLLAIFVLPFIVAAGFLQVPFIEFIYGEEFTTAIASLSILLPSLGIKMFGTLMQYFFEATGREKILPPLLMLTVVINILVNAVLIPQWGAVGASIATMLSEITLAIVGLSVLIRVDCFETGLKLRFMSIVCLLAALCPTLIFNGVSLFLGIPILLCCAIVLLILTKTNLLDKFFRDRHA